jgi:hypothetical protein
MATINVNPSSYSTVQAAVNAASAGDTLLFTGNGTWTGVVTISKAITINLGGYTITRNFTGNIPPFELTTPGSGVLRVTNGAMAGGGTATGYNGAYARISGSGQWRIDNIVFGDGPDIFLQWWQSLGLLDHCTFHTSGASEILHSEGYGPSSQTGWYYDVVPGSADAVYVEQNTFNWLSGSSPTGANAALQNYYGDRTVFRYNSIRSACVDVHGNTPACGRWHEFYENDFYCANDMSVLFQIRGGSGVIFNNRLHNEPGASGARGFDIYEEDSGTYPLIYQVGRGKNSTPTVTLGSQQASDPMYIWSNTVINAGGGTSGMGVGVDGGAVQLGRDVITSVRSGYSSYTYPHPLQGGASPPVGTPILSGR